MTTRRKPTPKKVSVEDMVISHEKAIFGYTDRSAMKYVPGLIDTVDEVSSLVKSIKKLGGVGVVLVLVGQLAIILHQYGLIPAVLGFFK